MSQPYVGEIRMFAGNFAPAGWMFCEGQLLPISENESGIFSSFIMESGTWIFPARRFWSISPSTAGRSRQSHSPPSKRSFMCLIA